MSPSSSLGCELFGAKTISYYFSLKNLIPTSVFILCDLTVTQKMLTYGYFFGFLSRYEGLVVVS